MAPSQKRDRVRLVIRYIEQNSVLCFQTEEMIKERKVCWRNKMKLGDKMNENPQGEQGDERWKHEMLYREKRDGVDLKAFSLFLLLSSRSSSIATCRKWQEKWSWGMKEKGHNRGHLGQCIFHFIIKNEHFTDEVALPDLRSAKPNIWPPFKVGYTHHCRC